MVETQPSPPKHPVAKVSVEATTHMGGIFESNRAAPVYRNRLTEIQMFENNGSTGVQKSNASVRTRELLSAKAETGATPGHTTAIQVASDVHVSQFGHVRAALCDQISAGFHVGAKFDGNHLLIVRSIDPWFESQQKIDSFIVPSKEHRKKQQNNNTSIIK